METHTARRETTTADHAHLAQECARKSPNRIVEDSLFGLRQTHLATMIRGTSSTVADGTIRLCSSVAQVRVWREQRQQTAAQARPVGVRHRRDENGHDTSRSVFAVGVFFVVSDRSR